MASRGDVGKLELILGPMFSGKTSEMFLRIKRHTAAQRNCLVVRFHHDNRYSDTHASTHDGEMLLAESAAELTDVDVSGYDVVGIDEGQFYPDLVETVTKWVNMGKIVVISALDGDFRRDPIGDVLKLVPRAESVTKLKAVCTFCRRKAPFTRRISNEEDVKVIGGSDKYVATCRGCFDLPWEQLEPKLKQHQEALSKLSDLKVITQHSPVKLAAD